jgi:hypothetical protein
MRKSIALLAVAVLALALTGSAFAQAAAPAAPAKASAPVKPAAKTGTTVPARSREFTGLVAAVDVVGNNITVAKATAEETFSVTPDTKIKLRKEYKLGEVPKGSKVLVKYKEDAGKKIAVSILIQKLGKPAQSDK